MKNTNNVKNNEQPFCKWTKWTQWTYHLLQKKIEKSRTKSAKIDILKKIGMLSDPFTDTGLCHIFQSSITLDDNLKIGLFSSFSCVKSALKITQSKIIKNFYGSKGMSTMSKNIQRKSPNSYIYVCSVPKCYSNDK